MQLWAIRQVCADVAVIEIDSLFFSYSKERVSLRDVSLKIPNGEFVVLAGANGSGKTTLLRHLNGLLIPDRGEVRIDGRPVKEDLRRARRMVGMVFQDADSQIVGETVFDDVAFGPENLDWPRDRVEQNVDRALETVNLGARRYDSPHLLSGGEKRRLAIAGVLAMEPDILVMDEPFANLDYPGVRQVLGQIVELHRSGHTLLISAHDVEKVIAHADRLIVLDQGCLVADGRPKDVIGQVEEHGVRMPCSIRMGKGFTSWLT